MCNPGFGFYKHPCAMYDTKNLLLNHVIEASGLRAEFGSYSINGHLSDFKNYLVVLFVGGVWMIW